MIHCDTHDALRAIITATKPRVLSNKKYWDGAAFLQLADDVVQGHTFVDAEDDKKAYRRVRPSEPQRPPIGIVLDLTKSDDSDDDPTTVLKLRRKREGSVSDNEDVPAPKRQATTRILRPRGRQGPVKQEVIAIPVGKVVVSGKWWTEVEVDDTESDE